METKINIIVTKLVIIFLMGLSIYLFKGMGIWSILLIGMPSAILGISLTKPTKKG